MDSNQVRGKREILSKLLLIYLAFVLYLYLANWLAFLNITYLPLWSIPNGAILSMVLLGVVAVTLYNSWKKRGKTSTGKSGKGSGS